MGAARTIEADERPYASLPALRGVPIAGHWPAVAQDPLAFLTDCARLADVTRARFGPFRALVVNEPSVIKHVLQQSPALYTKSKNYEAMKRVLGDGLLTSEGDFWRAHRKLAQPAFQPASLRGFVRTMADATDDMLDRLGRLPDGATIDVHAEMMRVTLRIAGMTLFGADLDGDAKEVGEALDVVLPWINAQIERPLRAPLWVPTRENRAFRAAMRTLDTLMLRVVADRRRTGEAHTDLLGLLMGEGGAQAMTDRHLRDEMLTLVLAGHETTANTLTWTWLLLAQHPEWLARVRREAEEVLGVGAPTYDAIARLEIADRVLAESMRLYPPAWEFEREPLEDDVAHGVHVPKGTIVMIVPYTMHRHPRYWEDPERFDPDRFTPERAAARPRYVYLPFGDGPRICIGKAFAIMEAKLLLAMMARAMDLELPEGTRIQMDASVTLRPRGGLAMRYRGVRSV